MKKILALLALLIVSPLYALEIDKENRIKNESPGYCMWCSIEMLGRQHKAEKLYNIKELRKKAPKTKHFNGNQWVESSPNEGGEYAVMQQLDELKIRYLIQWAKDKDKSLIRYAVDKDFGFAASFYTTAWPSGTFESSGTHAVVIVEYHSDHIKMIDPNKPNEVQRKSMAWFDTYWTGQLVIIQEQ